MSTLQVPGAQLHYDLIGDGPLIAFIPGAQGSALVFQPIAEALKTRFTILTYDRRGFSRSTLDGEQDWEHRLETDADDIARLITHVGPGPAHVFGSSSGAIVALTVLARRPEAVRTLIAHEPPAARFLPNGEAMIRENDAIYDTYRAEGVPAAMKRFMADWMPSPTSDLQLLAQVNTAPSEQVARNVVYWLEHELRQYPAVEFDLPALRRGADRLLFVRGEEMGANPTTPALRRGADRLLFVRGEEMGANPTTPIIEKLAAELEAPLHVLPGGHIGYAVKAPAFAYELERLLGTADAPTFAPS